MRVATYAIYTSNERGQKTVQPDTFIFLNTVTHEIIQCMPCIEKINRQKKYTLIEMDLLFMSLIYYIISICGFLIKLHSPVSNC